MLLVNGQPLPDKRLTQLMSTSHINGCAVSINSGDNSKFDVSAGTIRVVDNYTDINNPTFVEYYYPGSTANTVTNIASYNLSYISIDKTGTIYQTVDPIDDGLTRERVEIGVILHPNRLTLSSSDSRTITTPTAIASSLSDLSQAVGVLNFSGNVYSANGANLKIDKTNGQSFGLGINYSNNKQDPNLTTDSSESPVSFIYEWRNGVGGYDSVTTDTIVPGFYDDNTAGGTTHPNGVVSVNQWQIMPIRYFPASGTTVIDAGQTVYNSYDNAVAGLSDDVITYTVSTGIIRGWLIVRGGATDLSNIADAVFIPANKFGFK